MSPRFPDPARFAGSRLLRVQSDERLVALARDGYEAAFSAIVDRYRAPLERYAARIVGDSRAEDAVQQAFANAHRALMRDDRPISLKAWLYRITHNAALNHLRAVRDEVALDDETLGRPATAMASAHDTTSAVELQARLRETLDLIAALPATQRDALLLAELEGRSHDEIALALDIPSETVRHRVMQARTTLRAAVSAVVPYPIAAHLAGAAASGSESARTVAELAAGAGAGAVAIKFTAGLTATGALVTAFAFPTLSTPSALEREGRSVARGAEANGSRIQLAAVPSRQPVPAQPTSLGSRASTDAGPVTAGSVLGHDDGGPDVIDLAIGDLLPTPATSLGHDPAAVAAPAAGQAPAAATQTADHGSKRSADADRTRAGGDSVRRKRKHDAGNEKRQESNKAPPAPAAGPDQPAAGAAPAEGGRGQQDKPQKDPARGSDAPGGAPAGPGPGDAAPSGGRPDSPRPAGGDAHPQPGGQEPRPGTGKPQGGGNDGARGPEQGQGEHGAASEPHRRDDRAR